MTTFVALLRAVNVGGTGKLPIKLLGKLCTNLGLKKVRSYIQSGNVLFESKRTEKSLQGILVKALTKKMGRPAVVMVRTAAEMRAVLKSNPFPKAPRAKVPVAFLSGTMAKGTLDDLSIPGKEKVRPGNREVHIHYPDGMGRSKLKLPKALGAVTVRNFNTVGKLVEIIDG